LLWLFWRWDLTNYLPRLASHCDPPDFSLPSSHQHLAKFIKRGDFKLMPQKDLLLMPEIIPSQSSLEEEKPGKKMPRQLKCFDQFRPLPLIKMILQEVPSELFHSAVP
jgi:hypothetical protein